MKIGIVGGSIAGCSAAHLFLKEGHEVALFERSNKNLVGRGGGIGTTPDLLHRIKEDGLITNSFTDLHINEMPFIGKSPNDEPYGRTAWAMPMNFRVFQWNELWRCLRANIPDSVYNKGVIIDHAEMIDNSTVELSDTDNSKYRFDLVLFADGYNSHGRKILFPEKKLKYRGYVLWRGLIPESEIEGICPAENRILRLSYKNKPGHNVVYFIPNENGSIDPGQRIYNWAAYIAVNEDQLNDLMTDRNGKVRTGTLPPGMLTQENETALKNFISENTPEFYGDLVKRTKDSYIQVIYTLDLDKYYNDRMCLIGDAGMVIQPFTGSGVFKGYNNAKDLVELIKTEPIESALEKWSQTQLETGKRLLALGEQMEKAFIWDQPDFSQISEAETSKWWETSVSFPKDFKYDAPK